MDETIILLLVICMCCCCSSFLGGGTYWYKDVVCGNWPSIPFLCSTSEEESGGESTTSKGSSDTGTGGSTGTGEWKDAYATYYWSYPRCCKKSPTYDKSAPKDECEDYSGCKYMGQFAGIDGKLSIDQVKSRNIVAFFDDKNQRSSKNAQKWWDANVKGKKVEIKSPSGKTLIADVLDTCSNNDCKGEGKYGCCSTNALKGGGTLIDLEYNTGKRFWGSEPKNGKIKWRWAS